MAFGYEKEVEREHQRLMAAIKADSGEKLEQLQAENERLKEAIRRIADQDATVSVCDGNVTVTMDATLTPEEREAVALAYSRLTADTHYAGVAATLRDLLERTKGDER